MAQLQFCTTKSIAWTMSKIFSPILQGQKIGFVTKNMLQLLQNSGDAPCDVGHENVYIIKHANSKLTSLYCYKIHLWPKKYDHIWSSLPKRVALASSYMKFKLKCSGCLVLYIHRRHLLYVIGVIHQLNANRQNTYS